MTLLLKRRGAFSAAHNYWLAGLTPDENAALFGKWAAQEGHGHNYTVELTVAGGIDRRTGMVVNIVDIDRVLKAEVLEPLDGKFLNKDVSFFTTTSPTLENLAAFIWQRVEPHLPKIATLTGVRVWEMPTLWADQSKRGNTMQVSITRAYDFSASHRLHSRHLTDDENREVFGKCNNPNGHGHNYEVEVTISGEPDARTGMLYPLEKLDAIVDETILKPFDHKHLNLDVPEFASENPTSEMLTLVVWNKLAEKLPTTGSPRMSKVLVRETARNSFEYYGEGS
ncbi:MAG TPA: 6-carboxytetrahydropterin synthase [Capsulimonadaceae bacterium]|jgi:6-pyruvoyltetrahydropterin/6-carboxytetrahydropterin synthase